MNAFLAACQQISKALPCCLPSACGTTASSLGSCSSAIHELNQHFFHCGLFSPLLCSFTIFQASTTMTGALSALSQHCTVRCLFGSSRFWDYGLNSLYPMELGMLGQCHIGQIWRSHWARIQLNSGQTDSPSSRTLKPGRPTRMPAQLTDLVECPLGKTPWCCSRRVYMTLNTSLRNASALCSQKNRGMVSSPTWGREINYKWLWVHYLRGAIEMWLLFLIMHM